MKTRAHILAGMIIGLVGTAANACVYNAPPQYRIDRAGAQTVVLATVLEASYTGERGRDYRPWEGVVELKRTLRGDTKRKRLPIGRSGSSAACDDGVPPPKVGEDWIVYLGQRDGKEVVLLAYPIAIARSADPGLFSRNPGS